MRYTLLVIQLKPLRPFVTLTQKRLDCQVILWLAFSTRIHILKDTAAFDYSAFILKIRVQSPLLRERTALIIKHT